MSPVGRDVVSGGGGRGGGGVAVFVWFQFDLVIRYRSFYTFRLLQTC